MEVSMTPTELQEPGVTEEQDQTSVHRGNHPTGHELNGNGAVPEQMQDDALQGLELVAVLEALLFVSGEPIPVARLATIIGVSKAEIEQALDLLSQQLAPDARGIQLVKLAGGYRLVTKPDYAPWLKRLDKAKAAQKLSRSEIEVIRGVETSGVLRTLLERKLVRIVGRKEVPGRPIMYGTTKFFLEHFGLQDITQLPPLREFKELGEAEQALLPIQDPMMISEGTTGDAEPQALIDSPVLSADEGNICSSRKAKLGI